MKEKRRLQIPTRVCYTCGKSHAYTDMIHDQCYSCNEEVKRRDLDDLITLMNKKYHGNIDVGD